MSLTITDAGLAACTNAEGTGLTPVTLNEVRVYDMGTHKTTIRLQGVQLIEPARIYVVAEDSSNAEYNARELRFYTSTGVWFATARHADNSIIQSKGRAASFLLALELDLSQQPGSVAPSGNITFNAVYASETERGVVRFASSDEAVSGQSDSQPKAMTPENVREHGDARYSQIDHTHDHLDATTSQPGLIELATESEAEAGLDRERALTPYTAKALGDALYFRLNVTTRMMFASWPLPQGWALVTSGNDRMALLTTSSSQINKTGGGWKITGMQRAGAHTPSIQVLGHALTAEENGPHKHGIKMSHESGGLTDTGGYLTPNWNTPIVDHSEDQPDGSYANSDGTGNPLYSSGQGRPHTHNTEADSVPDHNHEHDGSWRPAYRRFALGEYRP